VVAFDVMRLRDEAIALLCRAWGDASTVSRPDHPFLLKPPDVVAGYEGRLYAAFVATRREVSDPDVFLARLALARLALPSNAICIAVHYGATTDSFLKSSSHHFSAVLSIRALVTGIARLRAQPAPSTPSIPLDVRVAVQRRSDALLEYMRHRLQAPEHAGLRSSGRITMPSAEVAAAHGFERPRISRLFAPDRLRRTSRHAFLFQGGLVDWAHADRNPRQVMTTRMTEAVCAGYTLDQGVPYIRAKVPTLLVVDRIPINPWDPFQALRAAALAGVALLVPTKSGTAQFDEVMQAAEALPQ